MSSIQALMQRLDALLQAGGWRVRHDIPDVDKTGLPPSAFIPQVGRVYGRQNAILTVVRQTSCTIAGYLDDGEARSTRSDTELASGYTGSRAVPVTSFDVEIDEGGQIQLTEILFDVETNSVKKAVTAIDSVETLFDRVVQRTDDEIARRIAPQVPN